MEGAIVCQVGIAVRGDMSALSALAKFLWSRRRLWKGPIIIMAVILGILFTVSTVAKIMPNFAGVVLAIQKGWRS